MPKINKQHILAAAVALAEELGYANVTRDEIAERAGVSTGSVTNTLGTMKQVHKAIVRHGVRTGNASITAQAVANRHPYVDDLTSEQRMTALAYLA